MVFEIEAEPSAAGTLELVLLDQTKTAVLRRTFSVPGQLRLDGVSSGDFWLEVGTERVSCAVTVNRELTRATPGQN